MPHCCRHDRDCRRAKVAHRIGHAHQRGGGEHDLLRQPAIGAGTQVCRENAERIGSVDPGRKMRRDHTLAKRPTGDALTQRGNPADAVRQRDPLSRLGRAIAAFQHHQVAVIEASGNHFDQHLSRTGCQVGPLGQSHPVDPGDRTDFPSFHRRSVPLLISPTASRVVRTFPSGNPCRQSRIAPASRHANR